MELDCDLSNCSYDELAGIVTIRPKDAEIIFEALGSKDNMFCLEKDL